MPSPFPGIDPYLEQPAFWSSFHARLIVAIADALAPYLLPTYYIEVETRTYSEESESELLIGIPDAVIYASAENRSRSDKAALDSTIALQARPQRVQLPTGIEIRERYLEVRELGTDAVITVVELLSPKNKRNGKGRFAYEEKRQRILESASHFIELDLLRGDAPMPVRGVDSPWDYRILVSQSEQRPSADLYGFMLQESIPVFPLPLKADDLSPIVDLRTIFDGVYDRAGYRFRLNYQQPVPPPTLSPEQQQWVDELLAPFRSP
jgi:Protein of unknown function (DUF4058)